MNKIKILISFFLIIFIFFISGCSEEVNNTNVSTETGNAQNIEDDKGKEDTFVESCLNLSEEGIRNLPQEAFEATPDNKVQLEASYNKMLEELNYIQNYLDENKNNYTPDGLTRIQDKIYELRGIIQSAIDTLANK